MRRGFRPLVCGRRLRRRGVFAAIVFEREPRGHDADRGLDLPRPLGALARRCSSPAPARWPCSSRTASAGATTSASTTRCSPPPAPAWRSSSRPANLMTLFLGLEWFSIALYIMCAIDTHRGSLEAGLKYLIVGGSARRCCSSARRSSTARPASSASPQIAAAGDADDALLARRPRDGDRRPRLQGLGGAVPHVDARRLPGRADAGDRVHVGGDEDRRARRHATGCSSPRSPSRRSSGRSRSR